MTSTSFPGQRKPVLGRHSRDHELKWPTSEKDFVAAYKSSNGGFDTVILGGTHSLTSKYGQAAAAGLRVLPFGSVNVQDFLESVDFWVYFHDDKLTESFGMAAAEAMAAGKICSSFLDTWRKRSVRVPYTASRKTLPPSWRNTPGTPNYLQSSRKWHVKLLCRSSPPRP